MAKFNDGTLIEVTEVLLVDRARDIAVLHFASGNADSASARLSSSLPEQGEEVVALGNPLGLEFSMTRGIVSAIRDSDYLKEKLGYLRATKNVAQTAHVCRLILIQATRMFINGFLAR